MRAITRKSGLWLYNSKQESKVAGMLAMSVGAREQQMTHTVTGKGTYVCCEGMLQSQHNMLTANTFLPADYAASNHMLMTR